MQIDHVATSECPTSLITGESKTWLELEATNRRTKEAAGASLFGPDTAQWPAWWVDVVTTVESARVSIEIARMELD